MTTTTPTETIREALDTLVCCGSKDCPKDQAVEKVRDALTTLEAEMKELAEALRFYAAFNGVINDGGQKARDILAKHGEGK